MPYTKSLLTTFDRIIIVALFVTLHILLSAGIRAYAIVSLMFIMAYVYYFANYHLFRKMALGLPMRIWIILTAYHWLNAMYKGVPEVNIIDLLHGFKVYSCMVLVCFWASIDLKNTIRTLILAFTLTLFIFMLQSGTNLRSDDTTAWATEIGQRAGVLAALMVYYAVLKDKSVLSTLLWLLIPLSFAVMSQTRNAVGMMTIMIIGYLYVYIYKGGCQKTNRIIMVLFWGSIFLFCFMMFYANSELAFRFAESSNYQESYLYLHENITLKGTIFEKIVGDRLVYYVVGWALFTTSPWTGIGMWNYRFITGGIYPLHSEYMIHLCEGGIIAAILWSSFIIFLIRGLFKIKNNDKMKYIGIFSMGMMLFCGIYAREFFYEFFYPIYGIILYLIYANRKVVTTNRL